MAVNHNEAEQRLSNPAQIAAILKRLGDARTLLTISLADSTELFNSAVLEVNSADGWFTLDELNPRHGHERIAAGTQVRAESSLQGIDTRFLATVDEVLLEKGIYYYRARLPMYLIYRQRRQYHRVAVRRAFQASIALSDDDGAATHARLIDLSAGGFGAVVTDGPLLAQGSRYRCTLHLPEQAALEMPVEIRVARIDASGRQQLGAMFIEISAADRRRIARTVMDLERELRRLT